MPEPCKHLNTVFRDQDLVGWGWCPDCEERVQMHVAINNVMDSMRKLLGEARRTRLTEAFSSG